MVTLDAETDQEVARRDLVKGYEFKKDNYLLLDDEDFDSRAHREFHHAQRGQVRARRCDRPDLLRQRLPARAGRRQRAGRLRGAARGDRGQRAGGAVAGGDRATRTAGGDPAVGARAGGAHAARGGRPGERGRDFLRRAGNPARPGDGEARHPVDRAPERQVRWRPTWRTATKPGCAR